MEIQLQNRQRRVRINQNNLKKILHGIIQTRYFQYLLKKNLPFCDHTKLELSIVFVSEKTIRQINKSFRGVDKVTDVLSFAMVDTKKNNHFLVGNILGDVIVCPSRAIAQAHEYNCANEDELLRLIVHGILHLLGYDHETDNKQAQRMWRVQKRLCDLAIGHKVGNIILSK
ncbi:MAG: rRNA maturation RNase YbeY [Thermodesulfovibrionales bacterium]|nr:rRNA maturation RNase YbeY [Thermodesulfovibrionales bacterium]